MDDATGHATVHTEQTAADAARETNRPDSVASTETGKVAETPAADKAGMEALPEETVPPVEPPKLNIRIAANKMAAYLTVQIHSIDQVITPEMVQEKLDELEIVSGIQTEEIKKYCENRNYYMELVCARGQAPVNGTDGELTFHFDTQHALKPSENQDGTIDYYNLGLIQMTQEGVELVSRSQPKPGKNGMDIEGEEIAYTPGKLPAFPAGNNTRESEDGLHLYAALEGCLEYDSKRLNVNEVYTNKGDVDLSTGNIEFKGSVLIYGDVREGMKVTSGKDIVVKGVVEGATLQAEGNISISEGMMGMGCGKLIAGGSICGRHFENSTLTAEEDVTADVLMNSTVQAGKRVLLKGRHAIIIGGRITAGVMIYASRLGTDTHVPTILTIDSLAFNDLLEHDTDDEYALQNLIERRKALQTSLDDQLKQQDELRKTITNRDQLISMQKRQFQIKKQMKKEIDDMDKSIAEIQAGKGQLQDYRIVCLKTVYPGVKIHMGPLNMTVESEESYSKFTVTDAGITASQLNPADKM